MAERSGRSADTARLPGCLGGTPPGPAAPHHSAQRGAAAAIALFIFPLFIRDISTSPLPSPGCRVRILAAGSQLTIFLGHLRVAQLGIGVFLFLGRVFKHRQVVLRVAFSHCWHCFPWSHAPRAQAEQSLYGFCSLTSPTLGALHRLCPPLP